MPSGASLVILAVNWLSYRANELIRHTSGNYVSDNMAHMQYNQKKCHFVAILQVGIWLTDLVIVFIISSDTNYFLDNLTH